MPSIQCTTMDSHAHAVCVPSIETLINENKMPASLSRALPFFTSFCNYMHLPFVILCKQCLQHTNAYALARSRRNNTTTNEWTKRTTTAKWLREMFYTCKIHTAPDDDDSIHPLHVAAIARESMWYVNICHTLIERYIGECGINCFFFVLLLLVVLHFMCVRHQVNAKQLCMRSKNSTTLIVCRTIMRIDVEWQCCECCALWCMRLRLVAGHTRIDLISSRVAHTT